MRKFIKYSVLVFSLRNVVLSKIFFQLKHIYIYKHYPKNNSFFYIILNDLFIYDDYDLLMIYLFILYFISNPFYEIWLSQNIQLVDIRLLNI